MENISVQSMSIVDQGSYGKYICPITILYNREYISAHPVSIVDQGSYGKYICPITILGCQKNISAQLRS